MLPIYPAEKNPVIVKELQARLIYHGFIHTLVNGHFGRQTLFAVRAFQASHCSKNGTPLIVDGIVKQADWDLLTSNTISTFPTPSSRLQLQALRYATSELGATESPVIPNTDSRVDKYQTLFPQSSNASWSAAFVYWCFAQSALHICTINPLPSTTDLQRHWYQTQGQIITPSMAEQEPQYIKPGTIFLSTDHEGKHIAGIVSERIGNTIVTIQGCIPKNPFSTDLGVFLQSHKIADITLGFINYG